MKNVIIVVPDGHINLSSITGSFEILTRANDYWQKIGNRPCMKVQIAGFVPELKPGTGFFSISPSDIRDTGRADLVIIPSLSYDFDQVLQHNDALGAGFAISTKVVPKSPASAPVRFYWPLRVFWKVNPVLRTGMLPTTSGDYSLTLILRSIN